ncbi:reverse transcriptase domain-containing protein [Tanacetum coccineum]|uniref:Reverse transcriptase domain-containing protein n=1 Tax=Tanacetum coccineum TaxID=301880 RepID=A0ABQ4ZG13_9ASTR
MSDSDMMTIVFRYHQYQVDSEVKTIPTEDMCSIVLPFDIVCAPLVRNYLCEELRSELRREHTKSLMLNAENAKLETELSGKKSSGSTASEKPKVLASGMYTNSSKLYQVPRLYENKVKNLNYYPFPSKESTAVQTKFPDIDAFSSTNTPDYTPASPDYSPASPGNTSSDPSEDLSKDLLASLAISTLPQWIPFIKFWKHQAATMANTDNTNRNTGPRETPWKFIRSPIGIEEAYKITWSGFKKLLIKKYYPRTEVKKMENEFYNLTVKGNDLKNYIRRFKELAVLCPTMVPNSEKLMEVFIGGLPRSIEGNVTASKPQTLEEANYTNT